MQGNILILAILLSQSHAQMFQDPPQTPRKQTAEHGSPRNFIQPHRKKFCNNINAQSRRHEHPSFKHTENTYSRHLMPHLPQRPFIGRIRAVTRSICAPSSSKSRVATPYQSFVEMRVPHPVAFTHSGRAVELLAIEDGTHTLRSSFKSTARSAFNVTVRGSTGSLETDRDSRSSPQMLRWLEPALLLVM